MHEATHAILDMTKDAYGLQVLDDEFLAFLSGAIALRLGGHKWLTGDVYQFASELAIMVIDASFTKALVNVEDFDRVISEGGKDYNPVLRLRETVRHHRSYIEHWWLRFGNDGV